MKKKVFTLAIVRDGERVLLGRKKRKHGAGFWNGFGGGVEEGESIEDAARRECTEEVCITPQQMARRGVLHFHYPDRPLGADEHEVHVFEVASFTGKPQETDEMAPQWFAIEDIPYDAMWSDDKLWLPLLLAGKQFRGTFVFDADKQIVDYSLNTHA